jgi:hypothetical protein
MHGSLLLGVEPFLRRRRSYRIIEQGFSPLQSFLCFRFSNFGGA